MAVTWTINTLTTESTSKTEAGKTTGTIVFQCIASEPTTSYAAERATSGTTSVASIGSNYPGTTGGLPCVSREARAADGTRMIFRVTCEYDSTVTAFAANPLDDPPTFDYSGEESEEPYFADTQSPPKRAVTTAGEPFATLPKRETSIVVIEYARNVAATASYATYFAFANKLNQGNVTIDGLAYSDGQLKVGTPKLSSVKTRDSYTYKTLTVTMRAREDGWDQKYESRGLYALADGKLLPIADANGNLAETPWPLDANGGLLALTATGADILLKPYKRASLAGLIA